MRRLLFALIVLLVCATAATGVRLHAATECERWIAEYRDALAHSPAIKKAAAARHRLHHYVHRKVVSMSKPKPRVLPARMYRPKMSREEALRKMQFSCGEVALDEPVLGDLPFEPIPALIAENQPEQLPLGLWPAPPPSLLAQNTAPIYPIGGSGGYPGGGGGGFPILGGVPTAPLVPGGGGGGSNPDNPPTGGNPPTDGGSGGPPGLPPPPPGPPAAVAPEPGSLVLVATGLMGVAGALRRRVAL